MHEDPRSDRELKRELRQLRQAYGAACLSLRTARDLADAAAVVVRLGPTRETLSRLDAALTVWEGRTVRQVRS